MGEASPGDLNWLPLRGVDQHRLRTARLQAHHAVQWLARAARAYIPPQPDDSHTSLGWNGAHASFMTHPFAGQMRLDLQITTLTLALHGSDGPAGVQCFALSGRSDAQARRWLGEQLDARGFDQSALDRPSPYDIPDHPVAHGAAYDASGSAAELAKLAAWYSNATILLGHVQRQLSEHKHSAAPLCCWPHHFDLATSTTLPTRNAEITGSVGCGLSPGDEYYEEPYFYVSIHPDPDPATLPAGLALGHWHTRGFTAAVATAHDIVAAKNPAAATDAFLRAAVAAAIKLAGEAS